ncbi:BatA domain-containing protein [Polaribacter sp. PL03]|uniref:BatA domain-containing protein n=1 Tax=Polaribacter sp. PL03 TaxID=3088353 RepID=UPI0029D08D33|nr:BatA domain-containing protein [Polaribacter sp. PL03]MDX6747165.1 BatA domain-containing protein [Polaribacter sp. PL03]
MQFKNPEVLYFLALLIIPIIVHLFQLQKFVKIPFTNVSFLQKLQQETRKSSRIKKWLILATRLLLFIAILLAFSQPYFSNKNINKKQHNFIYLDNSLSTSSKGEKGNLLKVATQEIIENTDSKNGYSLLTNTDFYKDISKDELKNVLLKLEKSPISLDLETVLLKINQENKKKTNTLNKTILISDFQTTYKKEFTNVTPAFSVIKLDTSKKTNISIDSVFINNKNNNNFTVNVIVKNQGDKKDNVPIAIFNGDNLISKQSFPIDKDTEKIINFTIKNTTNFLGKLELTSSDTFLFDNRYYFTLNNNAKTCILAIGKNSNFLSKIYTKEDFNFTSTSLQNVNYNAIQNQQLIILNELESIPEILLKSLINFSKNNGSIVIIPNEKIDISSYNNFLRNLNLSEIQPQREDTLKITTINYKHPIFKNVFSKKVTNFQYPTVHNYYPILANTSKIISFENNTSFISQLANNNVYYVASALNKKNSNFLNSPLIVPVFYNFGKMSFQYPKLAYRINEESKIEIETKIGKDEILTISNENNSFIPVQQTYQNKVIISTKEQPLQAGFYKVLKEDIKVKDIAFNYPKEESLLNFIDLNTLKEHHKNITISSSIKEVFNEINKNNEVHWLWKWFLALAIVSLLLEILILKFYKP